MEKKINWSVKEIDFILNFLKCEGKISKLAIHGYSYVKAKQMLALINKKIEDQDISKKEKFKNYLDYLVYQDIIYPEIAKVIYKKHKEELNEN